MNTKDTTIHYTKFVKTMTLPRVVCNSGELSEVWSQHLSNTYWHFSDANGCKNQIKMLNTDNSVGRGGCSMFIVQAHFWERNFSIAHFFIPSVCPSSQAISFFSSYIFYLLSEVVKINYYNVSIGSFLMIRISSPSATLNFRKLNKYKEKNSKAVACMFYDEKSDKI